MSNQIQFTELLEKVQGDLAIRYSSALSDKAKYEQIKPYIANYIRKEGLSIPGVELNELVDNLYTEMVEYSFLTEYLARDDVEEININSWDDVAVTYSNGTVEKIRHFYDAQHAINIVKRLLANSGMQIDDAIPFAPSAQ